MVSHPSSPVTRRCHIIDNRHSMQASENTVSKNTAADFHRRRLLILSAVASRVVLIRRVSASGPCTTFQGCTVVPYRVLFRSGDSLVGPNHFQNKARRECVVDSHRGVAAQRHVSAPLLQDSPPHGHNIYTLAARDPGRRSGQDPLAKRQNPCRSRARRASEAVKVIRCA
jgi:hypothetical protein